MCDYRDMENTVALTILSQLGNRRFIVMTGSKNFVSDTNSLRFKVGSNPKKITHCLIELTPMDVYKVTFMTVRGLEIKRSEVVENVYAEDLQNVFTSKTGLYTRL
jgi:hypothetical protein